MCVLWACLMRSRGKTNAHNKNRLIFFMLFLLAAERADAPTNDRLLERDAEAADKRITCRLCFFSWRKRSDVLWPQKTTKKKTSWERQTSANFSLNSQTSQIKTGTLAVEGKLQLQVRTQSERGFHLWKKSRNRFLRGRANLSVPFFLVEAMNANSFSSSCFGAAASLVLMARGDNFFFCLFVFCEWSQNFTWRITWRCSWTRKEGRRAAPVNSAFLKLTPATRVANRRNYVFTVFSRLAARSKT